jgi:hypothetical protein
MGSYSELLRSGAVTAAATTDYNVEVAVGGAIQAALYGKFDYGSGGTAVKCYLQGSYDMGVTWVPVANITFTTADNVKLVNVVPESIASWDADATQADDTSSNHIPPRLRVRVVSTGTYADTTLDLWIYVS